MKTTALVTSYPSAPFNLTTLYLDPEPRPDEVHVRIHATGICSTDVKFSRETSDSFAAHFPCVFGHEGAGIVQRVGSDVSRAGRVKAGDRVICVFSCCGECGYCRRRETGYCDTWFQLNFGRGRGDGSCAFRLSGDRKSSRHGNGSNNSNSNGNGNGNGRDKDKDGASEKSSTEYNSPDEPPGQRVTSHFFGQSSFARDIYIKETGLVVVPDPTVPFSLLAPLACGIMTGAGAMLNTLSPQHDMNICVVGTGTVGLAAIMALNTLDPARRPKRVIAVDIVPSRLELARHMGATHGVNAKFRARGKGKLMQTLMEITDGEGVHGSIDATGDGRVVQELVHACARKGTVVTVGTGGVEGETTLNLFEMVQAGCRYVGCQQGECYPQEFLPMLLQAQKEGRFPYHKLIKTYPVDAVQDAVRDMEAGETVKPVLVWD